MNQCIVQVRGVLDGLLDGDDDVDQKQMTQGQRLTSGGRQTKAFVTPKTSPHASVCACACV